MAFNIFVIPFFGGLIFLIITLIVKYGVWIRQMNFADRLKLAFGLFSPAFFKTLWEVFTESLLHRRMFRQNKLLGYMHMTFALGWFLLIVIGNIESRVYSGRHINPPYYPIFLKFFVHDKRVLPFELNTVPGVFRFSMDFILLFILSGLVLAFLKRTHSKWFGMSRTTKHNTLDRVAITCLWLIFPLRLIAESFTAGVYQGGGFLTNSLGAALASFLPEEKLFYPAWWIYSIVLGLFFVTVPWSRYMHIPTEVMLIFFRKVGVKIEKKQGGVIEFETRACPRCGVCIDTCQMNDAEKLNSTPAYYIRHLREGNNDSDYTDNCMLCGRCHEVCPVQIDTLGLRVISRNRLNANLSNDFNYLPVPGIEKGNAKVLYFAGCMGHLTPGVKKAMLQILEVSGVKYKFMDEDGSICCGRPMMMAGMFDSAARLIKTNRDIIINSGAKTFVTSCPICYKVFNEEYNLKGIEVLHHTQFIEKLAAYNMLELKQTLLKVVYHDPCELGRGSGIYDEPRKVLARVTQLMETGDSKEKSLCCGGSIGDFSLSYDQRKIITQNAYDTLTSPNPDALVTACPLCKKTFSNVGNIEVMDIAEVVVQGLSAGSEPNHYSLKKEPTASKFSFSLT